MQVVTAFSFGGGVQSTAALVLAARKRIKCPIFIFANTGDDSENPETLAYLEEWAKPYAKRHGIELLTVQKTRFGEPETLYQNLTGDYNRTIAIPVRMASGAPGTRKCTQNWKIRPVAKAMKELGASRKTPGVINIGISTDEVHRARTSDISHQTNGYPLLDLRISRSDCASLIRDDGLPVPPKSSCWFCPYKKKREWSEMAAKQPKMFEKACELEAKLEAKRGTLGKDKVFMTDGGRPLREAILPDAQLKLWGDDEDCSGYCWT